MVYPWLGALALLFLTGASLWMAWGLEADVTTAFLGGVFLGLALTEGLVQNFHRNFSFYYSQTNIGEVKRIIKRNYALGGIVFLTAIACIFIFAIEFKLPFELATIAALSAVSVALHRLSFVILYALKKLFHITIAYSGAFVALASVFLLMSPLLSDPTTRYFAALATAFAVLSGFAMYHHYRIISQGSASIVARGAPHFYSPITVNDNTLPSRLGVQLWECIPHIVLGASYFALLFGDRVLSWIFNPIRITSGGGIQMPLAFNSLYHIGADMALIVLIPAVIIQYVMASPVYLLVHNRSVNLKVSERKHVDSFLRHSYRRLVITSSLVSLVTAIVLNALAPQVMDALGGTDTSARILLYSSAGTVLLAVYGANSLFMIFLNRVKVLAIITLVSALVVIAGGFVAGQYGFDRIVMAYVAGAGIAALMSTAAMASTLKEPGSRLFARFV
jgi:hypothetical protein